MGRHWRRPSPKTGDLRRLQAPARDRESPALHFIRLEMRDGRRHLTAAPAVVPSGGLTSALFGDLVVVAALQRHPIRLEILRAGQEVGPGVAGHESLGLPDDVEL